MKAYFFLLMLLLSISAKAQNFLIDATKDTVWITGKLYPDHTRYAQWKKLVINDSTFRIRNITALQYEGAFYRRSGKRLWQRVIKGRINVYALHDGDTLRNKRGNIEKVLMMQKGDLGTLFPSNTENMLRMMSDDTVIGQYLQTKIKRCNRAKAMFVGSGIVCGQGVLIELLSGFVYILRSGSMQKTDNRDLTNLAAGGSVLITVGGLSLAKSLVNYKLRKENSLDLISTYNNR